jgi:hypothetical protein
VPDVALPGADDEPPATGALPVLVLLLLQPGAASAPAATWAASS